MVISPRVNPPIIKSTIVNETFDVVYEPAKRIISQPTPFNMDHMSTSTAHVATLIVVSGEDQTSTTNVMLDNSWR